MTPSSQHRVEQGSAFAEQVGGESVVNTVHYTEHPHLLLQLAPAKALTVGAVGCHPLQRSKRR